MLVHASDTEPDRWNSEKTANFLTAGTATWVQGWETTGPKSRGFNVAAAAPATNLAEVRPRCRPSRGAVGREHGQIHRGAPAELYHPIGPIGDDTPKGRVLRSPVLFGKECL